MARIDWIEQRLLNWQRWKLGGGGVLGHAGTSWADFGMPRDTYGEVPIPTSNVEGGETDDAVQRLPSELKATVIETYLGTGGMRKHCERLAIGESTLHARIDRAHRLLADHFMARQDKARDERERVEGLQHSIRPPGTASSEASGDAKPWQLPKAMR